MDRKTLLLVIVCFASLIGSCVYVGGISGNDKTGQPTVYSKVITEPNPVLMGHWRRHKPAGLNSPWIFQYYLTKTGDRYAVYYFYDSYKKNMFSGWASFTIDGDTMISGVDGATFFVKDGQVFMSIPGRNDKYPMQKID